MSWLYAFVEQNDSRYTKIGVAQYHYHDRFSKTQQCNPEPMEIAATWRFPTKNAAKKCEQAIKRSAIFPKWVSGGPDWFQVSPEGIQSSLPFGELVSSFGGTSHPPLKFSGVFQETLNLGSGDARGTTYCPHLYLIVHEPNTSACKLALSCYNWPTVLAHYVTYNPRTLRIAERWSFRNDRDASVLFDELRRQCASQQINPLNWYRIEADEMISIVSGFGASRYPRSKPIDDRVDYTQCRVPVN